MRKLTDENRFSVWFPELLKEWDYDKNEIKPDEISFGSSKKVWWKCEKGHSWFSSINNRTNKHILSFCPYCSGQKPSKENNLSLHKCSEEFDYERNYPKTPENFTLQSNKKVWWKCDKGHEWETTISKRTKRNYNCPFCSGQKPSKENNLSLHPVSKEFDYEKNFPKTPEDFTLRSNKKVWWKCEKGHCWKASPNNRTKLRSGCHYCCGQKPSKENNLSLHPVSNEFDYEKNFPKTPEDFTLGTEQKIWWKCKKEHSWKARINSRTRKNSNGCPECSLEFWRSKGEIELYEWCKKTFPKQTIEANKRALLKNKNFEIDVWFPELNKGIEFNGDYFHSFPDVIKRDKIKLQQAKEKGIEIIIVWWSEWNENKEEIKKRITKFLLD